MAFKYITLLILFLLIGQSALAQSDVSDNHSRILVVYYSAPTPKDLPNLNTADIDALAGASVITNKSKVLGTTQYVAQLIQQKTNADLWRIETVETYPDRDGPLHSVGRKQLRKGYRPKLKAKIPNLENYDTIFIGYPLWWYDLPVPVYSFLEENNLAGKRIYPFVTHGGSGAVRSMSTIADLQTKATVNEDGLVMYREDIHTNSHPVFNWLKKLGY